MLKKKKIKDSVFERALDAEVEDCDKDDAGDDGTAEELDSYRRADMERCGYKVDTGKSTKKSTEVSVGETI